MKHCSQCSITYDDSESYCPADGAPLMDSAYSAENIESAPSSSSPLPDAKPANQQAAVQGEFQANRQAPLPQANCMACKKNVADKTFRVIVGEPVVSQDRDVYFVDRSTRMLLLCNRCINLERMFRALTVGTAGSILGGLLLLIDYLGYLGWIDPEGVRALSRDPSVPSIIRLTSPTVARVMAWILESLIYIVPLSVLIGVLLNLLAPYTIITLARHFFEKDGMSVIEISK